MADYFGLDRIAQRMGVCPNTLTAWRFRHNFLMYRRHRGPRLVWYTNDGLIQAWEVARCLSQLKSDRERKAATGPAGRLA